MGPSRLRPPAGEGRGGAVERQVVEADVAQEREAAADLLEHLVRDRCFLLAQLDVGEELLRLTHRERRDDVETVAVAKTLNGRPVKLLWSREEDWGFGVRPRPMGVGVFKAGVDAAGYPIAIEVRTAGENYGGDQQWRGLSAWPYYVPHYRYTTHVPRTHVPANLRRATGSSTNCFYLESFIDELAHAAGKDPYQYRRELLARNPTDKPGIGEFTPAQRGDWLRTLDMAAKMSGWEVSMNIPHRQAIWITPRGEIHPGAKDEALIAPEVLVLRKTDTVAETTFAVAMSGLPSPSTTTMGCLNWSSTPASSKAFQTSLISDTVTVVAGSTWWTSHSIRDSASSTP